MAAASKKNLNRLITMRIRNLNLSDAARLLQFEFENRAWFEQQINPRPASFFKETAVQDHIRGYLNAQQQGRFHACVVTDDDEQIIGRANLRDIDLKRSTAEIGYRIALSHSGQGIATAATQHLLKLAYSEWKLRQVSGFVSIMNPASARVLVKSGFVETGLHPRLVVLKHGTFDCIEYRHVP